MTFRLDLPPELGKLHNSFHVSLLKKHVGELPPKRAPVFVNSDDDEFEVELIASKRLRGNKVEYLVHWKGYGVFD